MKIFKFSKNQWIAIAGVAASFLVGLFALYFPKLSTEQKIIDSPGSINTVNQVGNNLLVDTSRRIDEDTILMLEKALSDYQDKQIKLTSVLGDSEAAQYALQIGNALLSRGWNVNQGIRYNLRGGEYAFGLHVEPSAENVDQILIYVGGKE